MPWQNVLMMLLDRGRAVKKKEGGEEMPVSGDEVDAFLKNTKGYRG
jgi:hypothetical protein